MTTITIPDDVPLDLALDLVLRHGLRYDHATRRLLPRLNPGAGRLCHPRISLAGGQSSNRPAPASTTEEPIP